MDSSHDRVIRCCPTHLGYLFLMETIWALLVSAGLVVGFLWAVSYLMEKENHNGKL